MATDLMIGMAHQPGTLAAACDALGRAGVNIEGAFGTVIDGQPGLHVLVAESGTPRAPSSTPASTSSPSARSWRYRSRTGQGPGPHCSGGSPTPA